MKTISIILAAYNSSKYIELCLDSIFAQDFKDYEVIVIDNASKDNTKAIVKDRYSNIVLIENSDNFGPCKARNQGIARANGKYILCLDHDVKLENNFLKNIHKAIESQDSIGAVQPKVLMSDGKTVYSKGIYLSFLRRIYDIGSGKLDKEEMIQVRDVFGVSAAAALYRREALETVKQGEEYFDEDFFYFFEDVDLSWRLRKKSWRILYYPDAVCLHRAGGSRNREKISQYLCFRNRYLLLLKNESFLGFLWLLVVFFIYDLWRNLFMLFTNQKHFLKALKEVIVLSPKMVKKKICIIQT